MNLITTGIVMFKKIMSVKKDSTKCLTIVDYLNMLSNCCDRYSKNSLYKPTKKCIDIFDESNFNLKDQFSDETGYLGMTKLIYSLCHVGKYCSYLFNNIRFHKTNFRSYISYNFLKHLEDKKSRI